jgi:hypothetical protein
MSTVLDKGTHMTKSPGLPLPENEILRMRVVYATDIDWAQPELDPVEQNQLCDQALSALSLAAELQEARREVAESREAIRQLLPLASSYCPPSDASAKVQADSLMLGNAILLKDKLEAN